jgi:hypothetical protein
MKALLWIPALLALVSCATVPSHFSLPLHSGEVIDVTLHNAKAWECGAVKLGKVVCTNTSNRPQEATIRGDTITVPPKTHMTIEEPPRGIRL